MGTEQLGEMGRGDHPMASMHRELARRRLYVHPVRWTSLGLSLIEAMHLGMPVVALACTEVTRAVPPEAGVVSTDVAELCAGMAELVADPALARQKGKQAREFALARYGLDAFLRSWDQLLSEVGR
jgi:glycosyltransferase involved in cell wall biosynthesis